MQPLTQPLRAVHCLLTELKRQSAHSESGREVPPCQSIGQVKNYTVKQLMQEKPSSYSNRHSYSWSSSYHFQIWRQFWLRFWVKLFWIQLLLCVLLSSSGVLVSKKVQTPPLYQGRSIEHRKVFKSQTVMYLIQNPRSG